jgi:chromosome segregation ATPase
MAKSISGDGYKINIGMHIDTEDGAKQINNFIKNAERVGKPIKTTIEIDGKKFEQTIEQWENKLNHQTIKLEYLNQFQNGWKSAKTTVSASVTQIKDEVETLNLAMKEKHQQDIQAEKDAEKLARALEKEAEQAQKLAEKEALRQAKTAEKLKEKEAKEREKTERELAKTLEKKAIAEKRAMEQAEKHAEKERRLAEQVKKSNSIFGNFTDTFLKMVKFNTINLIYDGIIDSMRQAIEVTKDFDKAMTEFKKVTDTSTISLSEYTKELGKLGELTASTTKLFLWSNV